MFTRYHQIIASVLCGTFCFSGKETRSTFCCYILFCVSCILIYWGFVFSLIPSSTEIVNIIKSSLINNTFGIMTITLLIPFVSLSYRRSKDVGQTIWFWLLLLPFLITTILCAIMLRIAEMRSVFCLYVVILNNSLSLLSLIILALRKGNVVCAGDNVMTQGQVAVT